MNARNDRDHEIHITTRLLNPPTQKRASKVDETSSLLEVLRLGAELENKALLPSAEEPFDQLHNLGKHDEPGPAITDLSQAVGDFVKAKDTTRDFGITLVLAIRVNTRWRVAPKPQMTPREILALFELDFSAYSLYRERSIDLLPLDTPIALTRGDVFEAQRDGKYGRAGGAEVVA